MFELLGYSQITSGNIVIIGAVSDYRYRHIRLQLTYKCRGAINKVRDTVR